MLYFHQKTATRTENGRTDNHPGLCRTYLQLHAPGTVANWPAGTTANAHYKVCDECGIEYFRDGVKVCDNESGKCHGYVPRFLHYSPCYDSDYIVIHIGPDGRIKCWSKDWLQEWVEMASAPKS